LLNYGLLRCCPGDQSCRLRRQASAYATPFTISTAHPSACCNPVVNAPGYRMGKQIVLDESAAVVAAPSELTQTICQRRERTNPPAEFDIVAPQGRGQVQPGQFWPAQQQKTARHDKSHKPQVQQHQQVGD
jgi:hypothetical protein